MRYNNNIQDCYPVPSVQLELEILILTLRLPVLRYLGVCIIILYYGLSMPSLLIYYRVTFLYNNYYYGVCFPFPGVCTFIDP